MEDDLKAIRRYLQVIAIAVVVIACAVAAVLLGDVAVPVNPR